MDSRLGVLGPPILESRFRSYAWDELSRDLCSRGRSPCSLQSEMSTTRCIKAYKGLSMGLRGTRASTGKHRTGRYNDTPVIKEFGGTILFVRRRSSLKHLVGCAVCWSDCRYRTAPPGGVYFIIVAMVVVLHACTCDRFFPSQQARTGSNGGVATNFLVVLIEVILVEPIPWLVVARTDVVINVWVLGRRQWWRRWRVSQGVRDGHRRCRRARREGRRTSFGSRACALVMGHADGGR